MFVARRVSASLKTPLVVLTTPLILDLDRIENLEIDTTTSSGGPIGTIDYVRDEIVGFYEVSELQ